MYIPKFFQGNNDSAIAFMQRYSFATLVTSANNYPEATHLPFLTEQRGDQLILSSHFAKANPQANDIEAGTALVIFTEPHAYISPKNHEREQNVPTWNYIAVHAYGKAKIISDDNEALAVLEKMIRFYDADYLKQWDGLPMEYKLKMIKGIVAFDITITDLQTKNKLSQNRTAVEKDNIINNLSASPHGTEQEIANYMTAIRDKHN
jgi:transcriptional regulator